MSVGGIVTISGVDASSGPPSALAWKLAQPPEAIVAQTASAATSAIRAFRMSQGYAHSSSGRVESEP